MSLNGAFGFINHFVPFNRTTAAMQLIKRNKRSDATERLFYAKESDASFANSDASLGFVQDSARSKVKEEAK